MKIEKIRKTDENLCIVGYGVVSRTRMLRIRAYEFYPQRFLISIAVAMGPIKPFAYYHKVFLNFEAIDICDATLSDIKRCVEAAFPDTDFIWIADKQYIKLRHDR